MMIAACKSPNVFEPPPGKRADPPIWTAINNAALINSGSHIW
jgi:hypothetical protein